MQICNNEPTYCRQKRMLTNTVPDSMKPIRYYWKSNVPMENETTYRLSYWECPQSTMDPILPRNSLITGDGEITDETTYNGSYLGNWCIQPDASIRPCEKQWLGRGPIQDVTTQKHDYSWKCIQPVAPILPQPNLYPYPDALSDNTTYNLSYYQSGCNLPAISYAPIRKYVKSDIPIEDCTTYKLSYWPNEAPPKEKPWCPELKYTPPVNPMDGCTTHKLSFWPHSDQRRSPIVNPENDNLLNAGCCSDNNTTYRLSYYGSEGDKQTPIRHPENVLFPSCPLSYDTIHRMSFLGNWCAKPETSITPCSKQMLGRGPMQDVTTQKHDFTWKCIPTNSEIRPEDNLICPAIALEGCTTHKLSYLCNSGREMTPIQNYAPIRRYCSPSIPMEAETTMQLSYQPVDVPDNVPKPWGEKQPYCPPVTPMENNTTYNTRFYSVLFFTFQGVEYRTISIFYFCCSFFYKNLTFTMNEKDSVGESLISMICQIVFTALQQVVSMTKVIAVM
nr:stabilizer of axonemal microtubules 1-like [Megalopta genalis]